ncbi:MAG TPA: DUF2461 domain-containing protein [Acidimicrobiales bacterium]|nr:DUF2461 domain-containing protein [Acidimicrobiales bacterium]
MAFQGWPAEAIEFFEDLEEDNSKSFWQAHLHIYESRVKEPMLELMDELEPEFGPGRIFRPYRDVRFSKDKTPYKTNIAAAIGPYGYVSLAAEGLGVGAGMHVMAPDQLERYRQAVDQARTGETLESIVSAVRSAGFECGARDPLKTAPRGYPKEHPRIELLKGKGLVVWQSWPPGKWLASAKAKDRVVQVLRAAAPLSQWLDDHVGES